MKDKSFILKGLSLKNNQTIIDLGAGDGVVVFEAAYESLQKKLNTKFIALEINPVLIIVLYLNWMLHPNRKHVKIVWGDMFKISYASLVIDSVSHSFPASARPTKNPSELRAVGIPGMTATYHNDLTFYLYISPWLIEKVISAIQKQLPQSRFVSYYYPIKSMAKKEVILKGIHNTYLYN